VLDVLRRRAMSRVAYFARASTRALTQAARVGSKHDAAVYARTGLDEQIYTGRKVKIYRPARSAMTQGRSLSSQKWKIQ